jgi:hypothetical protein
MAAAAMDGGGDESRDGADDCGGENETSREGTVVL